MCITTNKKAEEILKGIRQIDDSKFDNFTNEQLSELYVKLYNFQKELEAYQEVIKPELVKREIKLQYFPDEDKKICLAESNAKTVYNVQAIYLKAKSFHIDNEFFEAVSFVKDKASERIQMIAKEFCEVKKSEDKIVKVSKMTKQELIEHNI